MIDNSQLPRQLQEIISRLQDRTQCLQAVADAIRVAGNYRWVGLYDVDYAAGALRNVVYSGPRAPAYPVFPVTKGLTSAAVAEKRTINVGDVAADSRYLTAFGSTLSEIIVPIFDTSRQWVLGTIDVESEMKNAFGMEVQALLERCADVVSTLWGVSNNDPNPESSQRRR
jgi:putative methionine-R-sulfoxide reductase with GAF domain